MNFTSKKYENICESPIRIGIDISSLCSDLTGIGRYTLEILSRLQVMNCEIFLYAPKSPVIDIKSDYKRTHTRYSNLKTRGLPFIWSQTVMPYLARNDRLDIFWCPTHRIPVFLPSSLPKVVTIHDLVFKKAPTTMKMAGRILDRIFMPIAIKLSKKLVAVSSNTASELKEEFPKCAFKINVIRHGIIVKSNINLTTTFPFLPDDYEFILFVGTIEPRKNLDRLIEAFAVAKESFTKKIKLVIVGSSGWGGIDLLACSRFFGVEHDVIATGYLDDTTLESLYARALFLAMPSLYEGFGLPLVEAMKHGLPVLTSNCSSMPEIASECGVLIEPTSIESIATGLISLVNDDSLRGELSKKALHNSRRFSWDEAASSIFILFKELLPQKNNISYF